MHNVILKIASGLVPEKSINPSGRNLKDFSNEELLEILDRNMTTEAHYLSCVCSEILRRILKEYPELIEKFEA